MASTDKIIPARRDIYIGDVEQNRPNSEAVNQKLAGNINFLLDRTVIKERFYFNDTNTHYFYHHVSSAANGRVFVLYTAEGPCRINLVDRNFYIYSVFLANSYTYYFQINGVTVNPYDTHELAAGDVVSTRAVRTSGGGNSSTAHFEGTFLIRGDYAEGKGIVRVENDAIIPSYTMAVHQSGTARNTQVNIKVYDSTGAYVNDLFGSGANQPSISGGSGTNVMVGKEKLDTVTPANILVNTSGHSVQTGNLNLGTELNPLLAGYILVPYAVDIGAAATKVTLDLRLKEI